MPVLILGPAFYCIISAKISHFVEQIFLKEDGMPQNFFEQLQEASFQKRKALIETRLLSNIDFFENNESQLARLIKKNINQYKIYYESNFLSIIDPSTSSALYDAESLLAFTKKQGLFLSTDNVEWVEVQVPKYSEKSDHGFCVNNFKESLQAIYPQAEEKFNSQSLDIQYLSGGTPFSNPVVFLSLFPALHVDLFLSRYEVNNALFWEIDPKKFALSCCFLDFEELDRRFGGLSLVIGNEFPVKTLSTFFGKCRVAASVWTRIVPGYKDPSFDYCKRNLINYIQSFSDIWVPYDRDLKALGDGFSNLQQGYPFVNKKPALSSGSKIVVVGSGPSLNDDIQWLKSNQHKVIIFACHSSVRPLLNSGIKPDMQFNIEPDFDGEKVQRLQLPRDVPFVTYFGTDSKVFAEFENVFLYTDKFKTSPVCFRQNLVHTHPTTGNTAIAFACFCEPAEMYLLGLDFAYRDKDSTHVKGGHYDEVDGAQKKAAGGHFNILVEQNFADAAPVYTRSYFDQARLQAENALAEVKDKVKIFNCSDGAFIANTTPLKTADFNMGDYPDKQKDLEKIYKSFNVLKERDDYFFYTESFEDKIARLQERALHDLWLDDFSLDAFLNQANGLIYRLALEEQLASLKSGLDLRYALFWRYLLDLLVTWYRYMVFASEHDTAKWFYDNSYDPFKKNLKKFNVFVELP